jgi:hypothetical protein
MADAGIPPTRPTVLRAGSLFSSLRTRRLNPIELVRETAGIIAREWESLAMIALVLVVPRLAAHRIESVIPRLLLKKGLSISQAAAYAQLVWMPMSVILQWLAWLSWSAVAFVAFVDSRGGAPSVGTSIRRAWKPGWRWLPLVLANAVLGLIGVALILVPGLLLDKWIPWDALSQARHFGFISFRPGELLSWTNSLVGRIIDLPLLYVAFAPLALALEETDVLGSVRTSWHRVRHNWLWLSGGTIVLWLLSGTGRLLMRPLHGSPIAPYASVLVQSAIGTALYAASALQYVNLMARSGEDFGPDDALLVEDPGPHPVDDRRDITGRRMGPVEGLRVEPRVLDVMVRERVDDHA